MNDNRYSKGSKKPDTISSQVRRYTMKLRSISRCGRRASRMTGGKIRSGKVAEGQARAHVRSLRRKIGRAASVPATTHTVR